MPRFVDLSAPIQATPPEMPPFQRISIEFSDHKAGLEEVRALFGLGPEHLRRGEAWAVETITHLGTHSSTHVDAPYHYNSVIGGEPAPRIHELPLEWFFAPGVVLEFRHKADGEAITQAEVETELARIGHVLRPLDIVLMRTGRDAFYGAPDYWTKGPGVSVEATRWLFEQGVRVMGIDAWGWDRPLHLQAQEALAQNRPGIFWAAHQADLPYAQLERLCNLGVLPSTGFRVACFPLRIVGASAAPARVVAILE
ncbi:MAG: cyclase family protein [Meiothermus sp.]|uniref:cyclase family protein n=1 Tax=Meiothermus sp. TaxID=1955249 RepID=UPI002605B88A|nr:cyclase family protein [Meiothermus sp.]MCS7059424.1 cyclase family protein [Meiothermus sp.]